MLGVPDAVHTHLYGFHYTMARICHAHIQIYFSVCVGVWVCRFYVVIVTLTLCVLVVFVLFF